MGRTKAVAYFSVLKGSNTEGVEREEEMKGKKKWVKNRKSEARGSGKERLGNWKGEEK